MKKICIAFVLFSLFLSFSGCALPKSVSKDTVNFYYLQTDPDFAHRQSVVASESRETYERENNLRYLLAQYFMGPVSADLYSPFPAGTSVMDAVLTGNTLIIKLSNARLTQQSRLQATLCLACLAKTCNELADIDTIILRTEETSIEEAIEITFSPDDFVLLDENVMETLTQETQ